MGVFYDYSMITLAVLYCGLFVYSNLKLLLSWCILGVQKGIVFLLVVVYALNLLFDVLMIIMIVSYHNDLSQHKYINHSNIPFIVRLFGEYVILYLNFVLNSIILLCFLFFFGSLFGIKFNKKFNYAVLIMDIVYFIILLTASMLIEFADITIINTQILSYIYITSVLINTIVSLYCACNLPIAQPIDLSIGLYQRNTICSCYTTVTRSVWLLIAIVVPQILFLTLNILQLDIWAFHLDDNQKFMNILTPKHVRIIFFASQLIMLLFAWNVVHISIHRNVELNIVLGVMKDLDKEQSLLPISQEIPNSDQEMNHEIETIHPPQLMVGTDGKNGMLMVHNDSVISEEDRPERRVMHEPEPYKEVEMAIAVGASTPMEEHEVQDIEDQECFKFQVIVDGMCLYRDQALEDEVFAEQIENKTIVNGCYVDEVIYLPDYKLFVSSMDLNELPPEPDQMPPPDAVETAPIEPPQVMDDNMNQNVSTDSDSASLHKDPSVTQEDVDVQNDIPEAQPIAPEVLHFKVVVDGMSLYSDKKFFSEVFSIQLRNGEMVQGYYVDDSYKTVYLIQPQLYVASMDLREMGDDAEEEEDIPAAYHVDSNDTTHDVQRQQSAVAESESLDVHNYSLTTKINVHAPAYSPDVDDIMEGDEDMTPNDDGNAQPQMDRTITPYSNKLKLESNTHDEMADAVQHEKVMSSLKDAYSMCLKLNQEDLKQTDDDDDISSTTSSSSMSSSSFEANAIKANATQQKNNNVNNERVQEEEKVNEEEEEEEEEEAESTANTEINYSYSSSSSGTDTDEMAPNIVVKF
eukprot:603273_1